MSLCRSQGGNQVPTINSEEIIKVKFLFPTVTCFIDKLFAGLKGRNNRDNSIEISEARTIYKLYTTSDGSYSNSRPDTFVEKKMLYADWEVRIVRNCDRALEVLAHWLSLYRPTLIRWWTHTHRTYIMGRDWKILTALRFVTVPSWKKNENVSWYVKNACSENTLRKALSKFRNDQAATNSSEKITLKAGDSDGKHHTYITPMTWGWSRLFLYIAVSVLSFISLERVERQSNWVKEMFL